MRIFLSCLLVSLSLSVAGQEEVLITETDDAGAVEDMATLDLNATDAVTLQRLTALSEDKIQAIITYRNEYGPLVSPAELQVIRALSPQDIKALLMIFYVTPNTPDLHSPASPGHLLLRVKYAPQTSVVNESPSYRMLRFRYQQRAVSLAAVLENDPGEKVDWNPSEKQYGPDHFSGFISWQLKGGQVLTAGNYSVHFAQGLLSGGGFQLGKGRNTVTSLPSIRSGVTGQRTLREGGNLSGLAYTNQKPGLRYGVFGGQSFYDAKIYQGPSDYFQSFQLSGYHRTETERENRKSVRRLSGGGFIMAELSPILESGLMLQFNRLSVPMRSREEWYDHYSWEGQDLFSGSVFMRLSWRQWHGWLEMAVNHTGKRVVQAGLLVAMDRRWSAGMLIRDYVPGYFSFDARAFGERTSMPENERGIYLGVTYTPRKRWVISAFADFYRFPWISFDITTSGAGAEYFLSSSIQMRRGTTIITEFRTESKMKNLPADQFQTRTPAVSLTRLAGIYVQQKLSAGLEWRVRFRWKQFRHGDRVANGAAAYNELIFNHRPWAVSYRITRFHTEDYSSRIYFYERDFTFSLPAFQGNGWSQYLLIRFHLNKITDLWIRYSVIQKAKGNNVTETEMEIKKLVSCQVRIKL